MQQLLGLDNDMHVRGCPSWFEVIIFSIASTLPPLTFIFQYLHIEHSAQLHERI
jgi:hypothetical protein